MNPRFTAEDQMRLWCDGRMSVNEIVELCVSMGYDRGELVDAWILLLEEGYTQRTVDTKEMRYHIPSGEVQEIPMVNFILTPPRT